MIYRKENNWIGLKQFTKQYETGEETVKQYNIKGQCKDEKLALHRAEYCYYEQQY